MEKEIRNKTIKDLIIIRNQIIELVQSLDENLLMIIPTGFNNNIYWHLGHILTTQISLLYRRCHLKYDLDENYFKYFAKGTSPADFDEHIPSVNSLQQQLDEAIDRLKDDLKEFGEVEYDEPIMVSFGHTLAGFADAFAVLPLHDTYHLASMRILKKFI